ncbi:MAG: hypothetical protein R6X12_09585 [bacterium]
MKERDCCVTDWLEFGRILPDEREPMMENGAGECTEPSEEMPRNHRPFHTRRTDQLDRPPSVGRFGD